MVQVRESMSRSAALPMEGDTAVRSSLADAITTPATQRDPRPTAHGYIPALDGLRALAVIAVLLYHADVPWARGGFLGVDVFFVLSGYLITALLLNEWLHRSTIDLAAFWLRRARRLLPALFLMLLVVLGFFVVFMRADVASIRGDVLAALAYVTNWYLIYGQKSYFEAIGRPSSFQHLWSLAVEEQFYLFWPLLFVAGMRSLRRRGLLIATLAGVIFSTALAVLQYSPRVDPSRLYYGTDTRALALLLGATLALLRIRTYTPAVPHNDAARIVRGHRVLGAMLDLLGTGALALLAVWSVRLDAYAPFLYRGGLALVALASVVVITAIVHPQARVLPLLLGGRVLRWIGKRSYGIYLWHWPVVTVTRPHLDLRLDGVPLLMLRVALTVGLAALSYHFVEAPIRAGAFSHAWEALRAPRGQQRPHLSTRWIASLSALTAVTLSLIIAVATAQPAPPPAYLAVTAVHITSAPRPATAVPATPRAGATVTPSGGAKAFAASLAASVNAVIATAGSPTTSPMPTTAAVITSSPALPEDVRGALMPTPSIAPSPPPAIAATEPPTLPPPMSSAPPTAPPLAPSPVPPTMPAPTAPDPTAPPPMPTTVVAQVAPPTHVFAIGDSVMVGASSALQGDIGNIEIDAAVSRQASTAIEILRAKRDAGQLGDAVIVHMGTNGTFTTEEFDAMMQILANVPRVVFVNIKATRPWVTEDNDVIAAGVQRYPNTVLVDWHSVGDNHPEYFWGDGIHLQPTGAQAYADLIATALTS